MKRILKLAITLLVTFFFTAVILTAQENKNKQHIKIIVADKSGAKVEIDTLIKGDVSADSIRLKNGEVIYLAKNGPERTLRHIESDNGNIFVTVNSDDKAERMIRKKITVISCDSTGFPDSSEGDDVIILKNGKHFTEGKGNKVVTWSSSESASNGKKHIYINEESDSGKGDEKTFNVTVTTDEKGNTMEKTKYVIAKDGIVVSIEGNDEEKVKDMAKDIESKLGVSKEDKNTKQVVKEETKKTIKK
jgi:hypothetical protein